MFKSERKRELFNNWKSIQKIDEEIVNIKIALHTLEKLNVNVDEFYHKIDELGIEFKKFKDYNNEFTKNLTTF